MKMNSKNSKYQVKSVFSLSAQKATDKESGKSVPTTGTVTSLPTTSSFTC